jgi:hypothetical protein
LGITAIVIGWSQGTPNCARAIDKNLVFNLPF